MSFCSNTINSTTNENISDKIHKQKLNNPKNIIIGHLNINSLRNKILFFRIIVDNTLFNLLYIANISYDHISFLYFSLLTGCHIA